MININEASCDTSHCLVCERREDLLKNFRTVVGGRIRKENYLPGGIFDCGILRLRFAFTTLNTE